MTDAQGKKEGICAGLGLVHEPPWDGGSTDTQGYRHAQTQTHTKDRVKRLNQLHVELYHNKIW